MKNFKINLFVIKSVLESICKRFRKSEKRENFNQKPEAQQKKTHSIISANYTHQYKETKEKLKPVSFIYVGTNFEHQVKDIYMHLKNFNLYLIFAVHKQISGTTRATNEQLHQQAPLTSFKTKISQYSN